MRYKRCPFASALRPSLMSRWRYEMKCALQALPIRFGLSAFAHVALARYKNREAHFLSLEQARLGECGLLYFCSACSTRKKNRPQSSYVSKISSPMRDQGLEPWTP